MGVNTPPPLPPVPPTPERRDGESAAPNAPVTAPPVAMPPRPAAVPPGTSSTSAPSAAPRPASPTTATGSVPVTVPQSRPATPAPAAGNPTRTPTQAQRPVGAPAAARTIPQGKGKVITISSGKGGVGKTTTTANLGVALARLNQKVVVIDADIGLRNLDIVMGLENRIVYDLVDVVEGRCKLRQAMIKHKTLPELYLIPAAQTRDKTAVSPADMIAITGQLRQEFDFILIDSPAGIERGYRNAVAPADEVLIVTNPEVSAVRDADRIIGLLEAESKGPASLILNRVKPEQVRRGEMLSAEDVTDILAIKLIGIVPEDEFVVKSSNSGEPLAMNDSSRAGQAYRNIARRLMGEQVPFLQLDEGGGFLKRLQRLFTGGGNSGTNG